MRAVVFKTKGKLDLRSITTFGLNAKPESENPIGYFGTGLKYAIAVLAREKIPVTFWIGGKQWVIEKDPSTFRNKEFDELYICSTTIGGLIKKRIKLPFTTEFGKNWELWQVFRELHANTLDEKGETFTIEEDKDLFGNSVKGWTYIIVESQAFYDTYLDRDKTFLKDGLRQRTSTDKIQVFDAPSRSIYYRGIRVYDFPKDETSELTYNILAPIELTEDRTAKSEWEIQDKISRYITSEAPQDQIKKVITTQGYERRLYYGGWNEPSTNFLQASHAVGHAAHHNVKELVKSYNAPKPGIEHFQKPLDLALCMLIKYEPPDSRAVSNEYVAMAAVASGDISGEVMPIIEAALKRADEEMKAMDKEKVADDIPF
jgi:hypothetical protein